MTPPDSLPLEAALVIATVILSCLIADALVALFRKDHP